MPFQHPLAASPTLSAASPNLSSSSSSSSLATQTTVGLGVIGAQGLDVHKEQEEQVRKAEVTSPLELTQFVDNLLNDLESRFDALASDVVSRLNSLSTRVDSLETSLSDLMSGTALPPPSPPTGAP
ncbi:heat shock factor-binding protein 1 [Rhodotorula toruloides]|uniref:Heat shock factor-binding protein 1 n=1 Tax=Rhodotorula toruloides TaxID=5286 RepID=A0A511KLV8_RHOTO|nr:heat shock factor-binding protein 1 [Rhodotorula toruloides]